MSGSEHWPKRGNRQAELSTIIEQLSSLVTSGRLGHFGSIEVVEIFATGRDFPATNVFSVAVVSSEPPETSTSILNPKRIKIDGFANVTFGIVRIRRPLNSLFHALKILSETGEWAISGNPLRIGKIAPQTPSFAPPDSTFQVPINNVLKNNFWAGSHVFRLMDADKEWLQPFFQDRRRLQSLSDAITEHVPVTLTGVPDLLGDIVIQVPVEAIVPIIKPADSGKDVEIQIIWRPDQAPRALHAAGRTQWDNMLLGASTSARFEHHCMLEINPHEATYEIEIWDEQSTLVAAMTTTSTLRTATIAMHEINPEPRIFYTPSFNQTTEQNRVKLEEVRDIIVGDTFTNRRSDWKHRRQELEEAKRLAETREFVQYKPENDGSEERRRALADIRHLVNRHGRYGVDLWDPYLSAEDILDTLFWCPFINAPLRALTAEGEPPCGDASDVQANQSFIERQRGVLDRHCGNKQGLSLEYRTKRGPEGWSFHDRFIIFPGDPRGPLAWSLGTSVNSLGKKHHILQKVPNPALIAGAFEDLWLQLNKSGHLIWRSR